MNFTARTRGPLVFLFKILHQHKDSKRERHTYIHVWPRTERRSILGCKMPSCEVCLDLDKCAITESGKPRWDDAIKDDLSPEHSLEFDLSELEMSAKSGCHICAVVWNGWGLMGQKLLVDQPQPPRGRFILQANCPLEVEIFNMCPPEKKSVPFARLQFYTLAGLKLPCFVQMAQYLTAGRHRF
jgi:hypothetical protein